MNFACSQAGFYSLFFDETSIYQQEIAVAINRRRFREINTKERFLPYQNLLQELRGVSDFSEFMKIISNPDHEDYEMVSEWAKSQSFKEYDFEKIESELRFIYF